MVLVVLVVLVVRTLVCEAASSALRGAVLAGRAGLVGALAELPRAAAARVAS